MPTPKTLLFWLLGVFAAAFVIFWVRALSQGSREASGTQPRTALEFPTALQLAIGFVTNFFDTLGIGSFATTTALFRFLKQVPDRIIPGTLNAGHTLPTILQAFIYIQIVEVDMTTLVAMIAASVAGAWLGAGVVAGWPRRTVQLGMGLALLVAGFIILIRQPQISNIQRPEGTLALTGGLLLAGIVGNFVLGALMTVGVGLYAPCMILVSLLGMKTISAFPIMMGSCAFLMPPAAGRFIRKQSYSPRAALGLALGGLPAVLIAAFIVKSLDFTTINWLVIAIVLYTSATLLRSAMSRAQEGAS